MEESYLQNDELFKKIKSIEDQEEEQENESEEEDDVDNAQQNIYKKEDFELNKVLDFFFQNEILIKAQYCPKCGKLMKLENNKNYMDEKIWRCQSKQSLHDEKVNIRKNSVIENINIPLPIIYFLILYCFIEKYSLDKSYIEVNDNKNLFGS